MNTRSSPPPIFPLLVKLCCTVWIAVLAPIWVHVQGVHNFLWLSDVGLFGACLALWTESRLLVSTIAIGIIVPDLVWTLIFTARLLIDAGPVDRSGFMFDASLPLFIRSLSLFHVLLPPLLVWMVSWIGYDRRGLPLQILLTTAVLLLTWYVSDPEDNINFVFGLGEAPEAPLPQPGWLLAQIVILTVGAYLPTHFLMAWFWGQSGRSASA